MRHYKAARRNGWVVPDERPVRRVGEPDGFGYYGVLTRDYEGVLCHECGKRLAALGFHVRRVHGVTAAEYRVEHGLPRGLGLVCERVQETMSERARAKLGTPGWQRFEEARDPQAAADSRDMSDVAPAVRAKRITASTELMRREAAVHQCPICGVEYVGRSATCRSETCYRENQARKNAIAQARRYPHLSAEETSRLRRAVGSALADLIVKHQLRGVSSAEIGRAIGGVDDAELSPPQQRLIRPSFTLARPGLLPRHHGWFIAPVIRWDYP